MVDFVCHTEHGGETKTKTSFQRAVLLFLTPKIL